MDLREIVLDDAGAGGRLDAGARSALRDALRRAAKDGVPCVLLTVRHGAWDHAPELASRSSPEVDQEVAAEFAGLVRQLFATAVPVVVDLDGPVTGFGLALALAADLRVARRRTTLALGDPAAAGALLGGATWLLDRACGSALLTHLAWTGEALSAQQAEERGLVSAVSDDGTVARALAERLSRVPVPAASALKRALTSRQRPDLDVCLDYESWLPAIALARA